MYEIGDDFKDDGTNQNHISLPLSILTNCLRIVHSTTPFTLCLHVSRLKLYPSLSLPQNLPNKSVHHFLSLLLHSILFLLFILFHSSLFSQESHFFIVFILFHIFVRLHKQYQTCTFMSDIQFSSVCTAPPK